MGRLLFTDFLIVGAGGFIGSGLRYVTTVSVQRLFPDSLFPYGTFTVNIIGCLLIGYLAEIILAKPLLDPSVRLFVVAGLLGGFTTFSAFSYENLYLLQQARPGLALINVLSQVIIGVLAAWAGFQLARYMVAN